MAHSGTCRAPLAVARSLSGMTGMLPLTRSSTPDLFNGGDCDYVEATSPEGVIACCYVATGTPAHAAVEEDGIVVIRAADGALLAEAHPRRPS
jgi:hypothetical protein